MLDDHDIRHRVAIGVMPEQGGHLLLQLNRRRRREQWRFWTRVVLLAVTLVVLRYLAV